MARCVDIHSWEELQTIVAHELVRIASEDIAILVSGTPDTRPDRLIGMIMDGCMVQGVTGIVYRGCPFLDSDSRIRFFREGIRPFDDAQLVSQVEFVRSGDFHRAYVSQDEAILRRRPERSLSLPFLYAIPREMPDVLTGYAIPERLRGTSRRGSTAVQVQSGVLVAPVSRARSTADAIALAIPGSWGGGYVVGVGATSLMSIALNFPGWNGLDTSQTSLLIIEADRTPLFETWRIYIHELIFFMNILLGNDKRGAPDVEAQMRELTILISGQNVDADEYFPSAVSPLIQIVDVLMQKAREPLLNMLTKLQTLRLDDFILNQLAAKLTMLVSKEVAFRSIPATRIVGIIDLTRKKERGMSGGGALTYKIEVTNVHSNGNFRSERMEGEQITMGAVAAQIQRWSDTVGFSSYGLVRKLSS